MISHSTTLFFITFSHSFSCTIDVLSFFFSEISAYWNIVHKNTSHVLLLSRMMVSFMTRAQSYKWEMNLDPSRCGVLSWPQESLGCSLITSSLPRESLAAMFCSLALWFFSRMLCGWHHATRLSRILTPIWKAVTIMAVLVGSSGKQRFSEIYSNSNNPSGAFFWYFFLWTVVDRERTLVISDRLVASQELNPTFVASTTKEGKI